MNLYVYMYIWCFNIKYVFFCINPLRTGAFKLNYDAQIPSLLRISLYLTIKSSVQFRPFQSGINLSVTKQKTLKTINHPPLSFGSQNIIKIIHYQSIFVYKLTRVGEWKWEKLLIYQPWGTVGMWGGDVVVLCSYFDNPFSFCPFPIWILLNLSVDV